MRVLFYTSPRYVACNRDPCIEVDFPLTSSGDLDMQKVHETLGLESCSVCDFRRGSLDTGLMDGYADHWPFREGHL